MTMRCHCRFRMAEWLHVNIVKVIQAVARLSVHRARSILPLIPILSVSLFCLGLFTNFYLEADRVKLWTPESSPVIENSQWIETESGFPSKTYPIHVLLHANGGNVITVEAVDILFQALNTFQNTDGYESLCGGDTAGQQNTTDAPGFTTSSSSNGQECTLLGVTNFFNDDHSVYRQEVNTIQDLIMAISVVPFFPNGKIVQRDRIFGYRVESDDGRNLVLGAQLLKMRLGLPESAETRTFEKRAIRNLLDFRNELGEEPTNPFHVEVLSLDSYTNETERALFNDLPLIPVMVVIMFAFSCMVYYRKDQVQSSCLFLGIGAVLTVVFSLLTSFGLLFLVGVPFTSLTAATPFIILGIGLDDSFIITGAYERTNPSDRIERRIQNAIHDCGVSILLTTLTTVSAFSLGTMSRVPAMKNFYIYAATCVFVDFIYQVSFFLALLYTNEKRKAEGRYDWLFCFKQKSTNSSSTNSADRDHDDEVLGSEFEAVLSRTDRKLHKTLRWYCNQIEQCTIVRVAIISVFIIFACVSVYGGSKLRVAFDVTSLVPSKSYIKSFVAALESYSEQDAYTCTAFFRDVDFSSQVIQSQMNAYINELVDLPHIASYPQHFWLQDFHNFTQANNSNTSQSLSGSNSSSSSFEERLDMFLDDDYYRLLYSNLIVRDSADKAGGGAITASAVILSLDNIDLKNVRDQVSFLSSQEELSRHFQKEVLPSLGVETLLDRMPFFTFSEDYFMWEFYAVAVEELLLSTIASVLAVAVITFLFIPRISVLCIVMLSVVMIYMDVLGLMYWAGFSINPVTLIAILMSIGLMVDYVLHVVMRCFEHHKEEDAPKGHVDIYDCLSTIGISVMIGGASTVLSTIPLAFSTSEIFFSIFVIFFGFVMFSLLHGLIFVPAILASFNFHHDDTKTSTGDEDDTAQEIVMEEKDDSSIMMSRTNIVVTTSNEEC